MGSAGETGSEASERPDGKWLVRVEVRAKKLYSAGNGEETETPLDQSIDIGLFAADRVIASHLRSRE